MPKFTQMNPVKKLTHCVRNTDYELLIFRVVETGEYRIYIAKGQFGVGELYLADAHVVADAKLSGGPDILEELIKIARSDIDRNEFGQY